jgi:hypothetical protein
MDGLSPDDVRAPSRRELMLERLGLGIIPTMLLAPAIALEDSAPCRGDRGKAFTLFDAQVVGFNGHLTRNSHRVHASRPEHGEPSDSETVINKINDL